MGTKLLLGFGGTVIQVVVHPAPLALAPGVGFGGTVIQVVVHHAAMGNTLTLSFEGTIN